MSYAPVVAASISSVPVLAVSLSKKMSWLPELGLFSVVVPVAVGITMLDELKVPRTKRLPLASRARAVHWSSLPLPPTLSRHPSNQINAYPMIV
jgi:hypothetical protein